MVNKKKKKVILHLGCGEQKFEGCINIDILTTTATDLVADVRDLPFKLESVDKIVAHHLIEHIPYVNIPPTLAHWCALLKKGGEIEISCPDADWLTHKFAAGEITLETLNRFIFGGHIDTLVMPTQYHKAFLTEKFLQHFLRISGINNIKRIVGKTYTQYGLTVEEPDNDATVHSPRMLHLIGVKQ